MTNQPQTSPQPLTGKRRLPGRPLTGPADPRSRSNPEACSIPEPVPVEGEGLLAAMRHVLTNDKAHDRTPEQKLARMLLNDEGKFFDRFASLEKAELAARSAAAAKADETEPEDEGEERCLRLIDDFLGEMDKEQAKKDAELAARPDAAKIKRDLTKQP